MATKLGLFPLEVWERILEHFVLTVDPRSKGRSAVLRVCSAWNQITEPLIYKHVVIFESRDKLEGLRSLAKTFDRYPNYAARVESLTVQFSASRLWDELSEDEAVDRFRFLEWMQEMKSLSIVINISHKEHADGARWLTNEVTKKIPPTCQSLELKLRCIDHNILSHEYYPEIKRVYIPARLQNLRLETLTDPWDTFQSLTRGNHKQLKKVVIKSDRLARYHNKECRDMAKYSRYVASAMISQEMPAIERMLLCDERRLRKVDQAVDSDIKDWMKHVDTLTYKDLRRILLAEGFDMQNEQLLEQSKSELTSEGTESGDGKVGNKWLLYKTRSKNEEDLLGVMYTFAAYHFSYEVLEGREAFSWCSCTNGARLPVSCIASSELIGSPREIRGGKGAIVLAESTEQQASYRRWTTQPFGWLSGVLLKACKDLDVALQDCVHEQASDRSLIIS